MCQYWGVGDRTDLKAGEQDTSHQRNIYPSLPAASPRQAVNSFNILLNRKPLSFPHLPFPAFPSLGVESPMHRPQRHSRMPDCLFPQTSLQHMLAPKRRLKEATELRSGVREEKME
jgi:hypothetical protein